MFLPARRTRIAAATMVAALLSGCFGSGPILTHNDVAGAYEPDFLRVVGTGGNELRTIVVGNPFGGSAEATRDATIEAMQGAVAFTPVRFAAQPGRAHPANYRVYMVYQPAITQAAGALCRGEAPQAGRASAGLRLLAVYCGGSFAMSEITGRMEVMPSLGDPAFRSLVRQVTLNLLPPSNPKHADSCTFFRC